MDSEFLVSGGYYIILDFLEKAGCEDEIVQGFVGSSENFVLVADPFAVTLVYEDDVFPDTEDGVHIVGVDYGRDAIFVGDIVEEFVDKNRGAGVETGVGFVAEQVAGIEGDGACDGHAFLHTAGDFRGIFLLGALEVHSSQAVP